LIFDSAEKPNSPKKGLKKTINTLPENQNGLYAILERIFFIATDDISEQANPLTRWNTLPFN